MAASKSAVTIDPGAILAEAEAILDQVNAASEADKHRASFGRSFTAFADRIMRVHAEADADKGKVNPELVAVANEHGLADPIDLADMLYKYGEKLNPIAEVNWSKDEVRNLVQRLEALSVFGLLDEAGSDTLENLKKVSRGSGQGTRGPRTTAASLEDRPYGRVMVVSQANDPETGEPVVVANQRADTQAAVSNVRNAIRRAFKDAGKELTPDAEKAVTEAINSVVIDGKDSADIGNLLRIVPVIDEG